MFNEKGKTLLGNRLKLGKLRDDVFAHLLGEDEATGTVFTKSELAANTQLLVVAGAGMKPLRCSFFLCGSGPAFLCSVAILMQL